jgi:hypothetical protein
MQGDDAGTIIAAIFQALQRIKQYWYAPIMPNSPNNSAHTLLLAGRSLSQVTALVSTTVINVFATK